MYKNEGLNIYAVTKSAGGPTLIFPLKIELGINPKIVGQPIVVGRSYILTKISLITPLLVFL